MNYHNSLVVAITPVTSLGLQGRKEFSESGPKVFKLCPILSNYVQRIFPGGANIFLVRIRSPWLRAWWLSQWLVVYEHHLPVTIYLHVASSLGRHTWSSHKNCRGTSSFGLQLRVKEISHCCFIFFWYEMAPGQIKYDTATTSSKMVPNVVSAMLILGCLYPGLWSGSRRRSPSN